MNSPPPSVPRIIPGGPGHRVLFALLQVGGGPEAFQQVCDYLQRLEPDLWSQRTLNRLFHRLTQDGLITSRIDGSPAGRYLTVEGLEALKRANKDFRVFGDKVRAVISYV